MKEYIFHPSTTLALTQRFLLPSLFALFISVQKFSCLFIFCYESYRAIIIISPSAGLCGFELISSTCPPSTTRWVFSCWCHHTIAWGSVHTWSPCQPGAVSGIRPDHSVLPAIIFQHGWLQTWRWVNCSTKSWQQGVGFLGYIPLDNEGFKQKLLHTQCDIEASEKTK